MSCQIPPKVKQLLQDQYNFYFLFETSNGNLNEDYLKLIVFFLIVIELSVSSIPADPDTNSLCSPIS